MPRQRTSKAVVLSVRLNPLSSALHRRALEAWRRAQAHGVSAQAFLLQCILRAEGYDPVTLQGGDPLQRILARLEALEGLDDLSERLRALLANTASSTSAVRFERRSEPIDDDEVPMHLDATQRAFVNSLRRRVRSG